MLPDTIHTLYKGSRFGPRNVAGSVGMRTALLSLGVFSEMDCQIKSFVDHNIVVQECNITILKEYIITGQRTCAEAFETHDVSIQR
jgi:hypothetical protein